MKEIEAQRDLRRAVSGLLTERINNAAKYPDIRAAVVQALAAFDARIQALGESFRKKYVLRGDRPLACFYIKGGNAFNACMDLLQGRDQHLFDSGRSDWDTQVVIDPWLPGPVQDALYAEIADIVFDEMREAGIRVAAEAGLVPPDDSPLTPFYHADEASGVAYILKRDEPQTLRRIFDHDRLGLWTDDRRKLSDERTPFPDLIPGIVLNDAIKPFVIYRLGYTWHGEQFERARDDLADRPLSPRPVLMELIDVTLPRRDTIEAVATWSDLERGRLTIAKAGGRQERWQLPLPDLFYHLRENFTMLCEIADGTSHHADKGPKRRQRVAAIFAYCRDNNQLQRFRDVLNAMAGAPVGQAGDDSDVLVNGLMARVRERTVTAPPDFQNGRVGDATRDRILAARYGVRAMIDLLRSAFPAPVALSAAFSDDLVLMETLAWNPYIAVDSLRFSGVDMAAVVRVDHDDLLGLDLAAFAQAVSQWLGGRASASAHVLDQPHNTARPGGLSYESTLVVFDGNKAIAFLTLTTASADEAPFRADAVDPSICHASLLDIAIQRKAAGALVEDYVVHTVLAKQYAVLGELLPHA